MENRQQFTLWYRRRIDTCSSAASCSIGWTCSSTGAQNDLQRATDMARHMITQYGMRSGGVGALQDFIEHRPLESVERFSVRVRVTRAQASLVAASALDNLAKRPPGGAHAS
jgi:hypothetical protein